MNRRGGQVSESFSLGAMLAIVGGFLDAYTYLLRGNVFANAQTGNIVLLSISLTKGEMTQALLYIVPIGAFGCGVILSEVIRRRFYKHPRVHWRQIVILMEMMILLAVAFMPQGDLDICVNVLISFICAMQVEGFRKVHGNAYATTMCTGNLRSAMEALYYYGATKDSQYGQRSMQYFGVIFFFILGAGIGTVATMALQERAVLLCCALLGLCFGAMFMTVKE